MKIIRLLPVILTLFVFMTMNEAYGQWSFNGTHIFNSNTGFVGIGNNSPGSLLYVGKNMTEPTVTIRNLGGIGGATYSMIDDASGANWKFKATADGGFKIRDHANGIDVMIFEPNSAANSLYINADGNVGIGNADPKARLEITSLLRLTPALSTVSCGFDLEGSVYYDSFFKKFCYCNGNNWIMLDGTGYCECIDEDMDGYDNCDPGHPYDTDGQDLDCDDGNPTINPGVIEVCDGLDNNCDGNIDGGYFCEIYPNMTSQCSGYAGCIYSCIPGFLDCNGLQNDGCETSEDSLPFYYIDNDQDGYGNSDIYIQTCSAPAGYTVVGGDCDDFNIYVNPGMPEICDDGLDNDCDDLIDIGDPDCQ